MFSPFPWHCFLFSPFSSVLKSSILQDIVPQDQTMPVYDLFYHISALPGTILFLFFSLPLNFVYISILIKKLLWLSTSCSCSFPETSLNRSIAFCSNAFAFFTSFSSHMSLERPLSQSETSFFKRLITICIWRLCRRYLSGSLSLINGHLAGTLFIVRLCFRGFG